MNAEVRQMKTAAELGLAEAFAGRPKLPGEAEIDTLRQVAFRDFEARGLPHRRVEEWKYTDLRALMRDAKPLAAPPGASAKAGAKDAARALADLEARRLVFVDGSFVPELSDAGALQAGLTIRPLSQALASGDALIAKHLAKVRPSDDPAVALNTALMSDGAVIHVAAGVAVERPILLVFYADGGQPASVFTRSLVVVEEGARVMLVESHEGSATEHQVNTALELVVGDNAHVDHVKLTGAGAGLHLSTLMASVGAHARFDTFVFTAHAPLVRNQIFVRFAGEGSIGGVRGATLAKDRQHVDNTLVVDHLAPGCQSREVFKSVLDGESRGVFQGRINVHQKAQQTDAKMAAHALLLSESAEANSKPELEIFADDVQCGHGATVGALDDELLFYLKARGIPTKEAEALLIQAFVGEAVEGIEHAELREVLMEHVGAWLAARRA